MKNKKKTLSKILVCKYVNGRGPIKALISIQFFIVIHWSFRRVFVIT